MGGSVRFLVGKRVEGTRYVYDIYYWFTTKTCTEQNEYGMGSRRRGRGWAVN